MRLLNGTFILKFFGEKKFIIQEGISKISEFNEYFETSVALI